MAGAHHVGIHHQQWIWTAKKQEKIRIWMCVTIKLWNENGGSNFIVVYWLKDYKTTFPLISELVFLMIIEL